LPDDVDFHEETIDPLVADLRISTRFEKWTRDGTKVDSPLYARNKHGVLDQWPPPQRAFPQH
jgi:hypothetical protein